MKSIIILLCLACSNFSFSQTDSIAIDGGRLPENIYPKGYYYPETARIYGDPQLSFNYDRLNIVLYNTSDSSGFTGIVHTFNNKEVYYGGTYVFNDETTCRFVNGTREYCKTVKYKRAHAKYGGNDSFRLVHNVYEAFYSSNGNVKDSSFRYTYKNDVDYLTSYSHEYWKGDTNIREEMGFIEHDTIINVKYVNDKPHGVWLVSIPLYTATGEKKVLKYYCRYEYEKLTDVLHPKCLFIGTKNEILNKDVFFENYHDHLMWGNYDFYAVEDQLLPISTNCEIILKVHDIGERSGDRISLKGLKKIQRQLKKAEKEKSKR